MFNPAAELHRTILALWQTAPPQSIKEAQKDVLNADLTGIVKSVEFVKRKVSDFGGTRYASQLPNYFCKVNTVQTTILLTTKIN